MCKGVPRRLLCQRRLLCHLSTVDPLNFQRLRPGFECVVHSGPAMTAPGAQFFERRLQRARAVPEAERTPEVRAFLEGVRLLQDATDLLPLNTSGGGQRCRRGAQPATRRCEPSGCWHVLATSVQPHPGSPHGGLRVYTYLQLFGSPAGEVSGS